MTRRECVSLIATNLDNVNQQNWHVRSSGTHYRNQAMTEQVDKPFAEAEAGTVLRPDQAAIVYDEENGYQILLPQGEDTDKLPLEVFALVAAAMRLNDDEAFRNEMVQWLEEKHNDQEHEAVVTQT